MFFQRKPSGFPWRRASPGDAGSAERAVAWGPRPWLDAHLLMNALNQITARMHSMGGEADPRLFAVAGYLQAGLASAEPEAGFDAEGRLLESYVELLAGVRHHDALRLEVQPRPPRAAPDELLPRHVSCDLLGTLLRSLLGAQPGQAVHVHWQWPEPGEAARLEVRAPCADAELAAKRLDEAMLPLCARLAEEGWEAAWAIRAEPGDSIAWSARIKRRLP